VRIAELRVTARIAAYVKISRSVWNVEDVCPHNYTLSEMMYATPACGGVSARYIVRRWKEPWKEYEIPTSETDADVHVFLNQHEGEIERILEEAVNRHG
jgi:hypothetical protein